jgi:hypothetical protein
MNIQQRPNYKIKIPTQLTKIKDEIVETRENEREFELHARN